MRRRAFLGLASATGVSSVAGCTGVFDDQEETLPANRSAVAAENKSGPGTKTAPADRSPGELPESCPVSTIDGFEPPDTLTPKSVEKFIRGYEEAYMFEERFLTYEDQLLTEGTVLSVEERDAGYAVEAQFSGLDVILSVSVRAVPDDAEVEPVAIDTVESPPLVETARQAVKEGARVETSLPQPEANTKENSRAQKLSETVEALPGEQDSGYVSVDGTTVRLWVDVRQIYADYLNYTVLYYVDSTVVRRSSFPKREATATDGALVECYPAE